MRKISVSSVDHRDCSDRPAKQVESAVEQGMSPTATPSGVVLRTSDVNESGDQKQRCRVSGSGNEAHRDWVPETPASLQHPDEHCCFSMFRFKSMNSAEEEADTQRNLLSVGMIVKHGRNPLE